MAIEIDEYLEKVPPLYRSLQERVLKTGDSRAEAVKAKCQACVGFEDTRDRIRECCVKTCALWHWRPYVE